MHVQPCVAITIDPLTALGLAASIVQSVEFAHGIITDTKEIRDRGSTKDVDDLKKSTNDLISLSNGLADGLSDRLNPVPGVNDHLSKGSVVGLRRG